MSVAKTLMSNTFIVFIIKSTIDLPECLMQHFRKLLYFQGRGASAWRSAAELSTCLVEKREIFRQIKTHDNGHKTRGRQARKYLKKRVVSAAGGNRVMDVRVLSGTHLS